jgi:hypothetical protein
MEWRRVDFFGSFENNIKDRCVEKDWYFILTEEFNTPARSLPVGSITIK